MVSILFGLIAGFVIWTYWGNTSIQITKINITGEETPKALQGLTIIHISDLHNTEFGEEQKKLLDAMKEADPDFIAVTGDLIDSRKTDLGKAMTFIYGAVKIAPVYYVTGNHESRVMEYKELEEKMLQAGVYILKDESVIWEYDGFPVQVSGLNDPAFYSERDIFYERSGPIDEKLKGLIDEDQYTILLSHRPELFELYSDNKAELVLSGHAHGGQFRLPFIGGIVAPGQGFFPKYTTGLYERDHTKMVVSRGLGNSLFPFRVNNRPEIIQISFHNE